RPSQSPGQSRSATKSRWSSRERLLRVTRVRDSRRRPVELGQLNRERLVVGQRPVLQEAQRDGLSQQQRSVSIAAPVDARVDAVTEADVVPELVEFAVDGQLARV